MYMIMNKYGQLVTANGIMIKDQVLNAAKARAKALHERTGNHFTVVEVKKIWSTKNN